jgi:hypothetical protein
MLGRLFDIDYGHGRADLGILRGKTGHEWLIWYPGTHAGLITCGLMPVTPGLGVR